MRGSLPNTSLIELLLGLLLFLVLGLLMTDTPELFSHPKLRFLYRSGIPLYRGSASVASGPQRPTVHRWQIEHWMTDSTYFFPYAVEDGPGKFLLIEFIGAWVYRLPTPLRAAIQLPPNGSSISVKAYLTWTHTLLLLFFILLPIVGSSTSPQLPIWCGGLPLATYALATVALFRRQTKMFNRVAHRMAGHLSRATGTDQPAA